MRKLTHLQCENCDIICWNRKRAQIRLSNMRERRCTIYESYRAGHRYMCMGKVRRGKQTDSERGELLTKFARVSSVPCDFPKRGAESSSNIHTCMSVGAHRHRHLARLHPKSYRLCSTAFPFSKSFPVWQTYVFNSKSINKSSGSVPERFYGSWEYNGRNWEKSRVYRGVSIK